MTRNINDASLANLKHYEGKWRSGATRTIRVPVTLADATLEYARQLDQGVQPHDTGELSDEIKQLKGGIERLQNELGNLQVQNETLKQRLDSSQLQGSWVQRDLELGVKRTQELRSQIETLKAENEALRTAQPVAQFELPEPADLLNKLKAKRKKTTTSLADIEAILEILEE